MDGQAGAKPRVTWIEMVIVAVVLVVLAALVMPPFSQAGMDPRRKELLSAVQIVQGQIEMYRLQHDNRYPTFQRFIEQMTQPTNSNGQVGADGTGGFDLGPYLRSIPANPYTGTSNIGRWSGGPSAWLYNEATGEFQPNTPNGY